MSALGPLRTNVLYLAHGSMAVIHFCPDTLLTVGHRTDIRARFENIPSAANVSWSETSDHYTLNIRPVPGRADHLRPAIEPLVRPRFRAAVRMRAIVGRDRGHYVNTTFCALDVADNTRLADADVEAMRQVAGIHGERLELKLKPPVPHIGFSLRIATRQLSDIKRIMNEVAAAGKLLVLNNDVGESMLTDDGGIYCYDPVFDGPASSA